MFGHDNQDNQDEHKNTVQPTHADAPADAAASTAADAPAADTATLDASAADTELGSFLPGTAEPTKAATPAAASSAATDDLLDIKQEALQALTPLVGHLDQTPEERFRTTMMMIQAADNQALIKTAYDAAKQISGEKERAQALLDIINEINYFTQHNQAA